MNMEFGTWNVMSFCGAGSLETGTNELEMFILGLVAVQRV